MPFYHAPVRLAVKPLRDSQLRVVERLAPAPDSLPEDHLSHFWTLEPPDYLAVGESNGFSGAAMHFRVRGDSLIGVLQGFTDVIIETTDTATDTLTAVRGRRVPCSATRPG